jgi:hypothetical protein
MVVFPFAFHIAVQHPLKPLWSLLLLCDHVPSWPSTVLCFMSLLPASGEFVSAFPSPRVVSFFLHSWPYRLGWPYQELKLTPALLSGSWGVLGSPTTLRFLTPISWLLLKHCDLMQVNGFSLGVRSGL